MALPLIPILLGLGAAGIGGAAFKGGDSASEKWRRGEYGPQGPLGRVISAPIAGVSDIIGGLNYLVTGNQGGGSSAAVTPGNRPLPGSTNWTTDEAAAFYDTYMGGGGGGGGVSAAQSLNQQELAALKDYWQNLNVYGGNRAAALRDMFSGVSAARARAGQATERAGTNLAADIENLYSRLGAQSAQPMAAAGSPTAGLAPASGAMATAAQTVPAEGANLANYLAAATGAEARNIYDIAAAQATQGTSLTQNFLDALAMAEQQAMLEQRQRAAARIAQAQAAASAAAAQAARDRNAFIMEYELGQRQQANAAGAAEFVMANLKNTDKDAYDRIAKTTMSEYGVTPEEFARQRPEFVSALLGG